MTRVTYQANLGEDDIKDIIEAVRRVTSVPAESYQSSENVFEFTVIPTGDSLHIAPSACGGYRVVIWSGASHMTVWAETVRMCFGETYFEVRCAVNHSIIAIGTIPVLKEERVEYSY